LAKLEQNQNYGQLALQLTATKTFDLSIRFPAALLFKNFVRKHWMVRSNLFFDFQAYLLPRQLVKIANSPVFLTL